MTCRWLAGRKLGTEAKANASLYASMVRPAILGRLGLPYGALVARHKDAASCWHLADWLGSLRRTAYLAITGV